MLYKEELDSSIMEKICICSSLDDQLRKQMLQSVLDGLNLGGLAPKLKDINNSLRQFYTIRRNSKLISVD